MAYVRTVCGDIDPAQLGATYLHEHLIGASLQPGSDPDLTLDSEAAAIKELRHFVSAGGRAMVEMSPQDYGRDVRALKRVSEASDVHIITVSGFIKGASLNPFVEGRTPQQVADDLIRDVCDGVDGTGIRAGVLKAGSSKNKITPNEETALKAAAIAYHETGAAISTHTEAGTMALEQVALLKGAGVPAERILIGHMDRLMDWEYHVAVANTGVTLGYDQFAKEKYYPDSQRIEFIVRLTQAGFRDQIALSGDMARKSYLTSYGGGPGFTYILWRVLPWLREEGLTDDDIDALMVRTPARLLSIDR